MVLHPGGCGRVGHRRTTIRSRAPTSHGRGSPAFKPPLAQAPTYASGPEPLNTQGVTPSFTSSGFFLNALSDPAAIPRTLHHILRVFPAPPTGRGPGLEMRNQGPAGTRLPLLILPGNQGVTIGDFPVFYQGFYRVNSEIPTVFSWLRATVYRRIDGDASIGGRSP
jgi:hypothetical protein